jgi:hypothetical protein
MKVKIMKNESLFLSAFCLILLGLSLFSCDVLTPDPVHKLFWDPITITYHFGDEIYTQDVPVDTSEPLSLNQFKKTYYTFIGWDKSADAATVVYTNGQETEVLYENMDLYAVWEPLSVLYDVTGGANTPVYKNGNEPIISVPEALTWLATTTNYDANAPQVNYGGKLGGTVWEIRLADWSPDVKIDPVTMGGGGGPYAAIGCNPALEAGKTVSITISSEGAPRSLGLSGPGSLFYLSTNSGINLTLKNVTLKGIGRNGNSGNLGTLPSNWIQDDSYMPPGWDASMSSMVNDLGNTVEGSNTYHSLIYVGRGNTLTLEAGATLQGNYGGEGSTSTYVQNYWNTTDTTELYTPGAGVCINGGTMVMKEGSLVAYNACWSDMGWKKDSFDDKNGHGGGVAVLCGTAQYPSVFTMEGGKVRHNRAGLGGGVYVSNSDNNNDAPFGGKVRSRFTFTGNAEISDNEAMSHGGGLYYINLDYDITNTSASVFSFTGGLITGNYAVLGGGMAMRAQAYCYTEDPPNPTNRGTTTIAGGSITGNTAAESQYLGHDLGIRGEDGARPSITISGNGKIGTKGKLRTLLGKYAGGYGIAAPDGQYILEFGAQSNTDVPRDGLYDATGLVS